jgi:hypothetical protein
VKKQHNPKFLSDGMVLVGLTGLNSSTLLGHSCFKRKIMEPEKSEVLSEFCIEHPRLIRTEEMDLNDELDKAKKMLHGIENSNIPTYDKRPHIEKLRKKINILERKKK